MVTEKGTQRVPDENGPRRPSGKHPYKPHISTKLKWALDDASQKAISAQRHLRLCLDWVTEMRALIGIDNRVLAQLGKLDHHLAHLALDVTETERILATALATSQPEKPPPSPFLGAVPKPVRAGKMSKQELDLTILTMFRDDLSYRAIGERLDVSYEYVRLVLKEQGVQPRPRGGRRKKA